MTALAQKLMTAEEFLAWAEARPEKHWELFHGAPQMQQSQTWGHANLKGLIYAAFLRETRTFAPDHFAAVDGLVVKVDANTAFEPDVVVYAGPRMHRGEIVVPRPIIAVEVLSQSTARKDLTDKLADISGTQHRALRDRGPRRAGADLLPPPRRRDCTAGNLEEWSPAPQSAGDRDRTRRNF